MRPVLNIQSLSSQSYVCFLVKDFSSHKQMESICLKMMFYRQLNSIPKIYMSTIKASLFYQFHLDNCMPWIISAETVGLKIFSSQGQSKYFCSSSCLMFSCWRQCRPPAPAAMRQCGDNIGFPPYINHTPYLYYPYDTLITFHRYHLLRPKTNILRCFFPDAWWF